MFEAALIFFVGLIAGFIGAQVGGGGLLTLPVLIFLGLSPASAIAVNSFFGLFLNLTAAVRYIKNKKINLKLILPLAAVSILGATLGANITLSVDEILLKKIITALLIFLLFFTLLNKKLGLKDRQLKITKLNFVILLVMTFILGIYGGFAGIAVTAFLSLLFVFSGQSFTQSMGYAIILTAFLSIGSLVVFALNKVVVWELAIPQTIGAIIGAWIGAKFGLKKGNAWIKFLFITLMSIFILKLLWEILL